MSQTSQELTLFNNECLSADDLKLPDCMGTVSQYQSEDEAWLRSQNDSLLPFV